LAVIHEGEIVWQGAYGLADREAVQPMRTDTVFQAASISKPVTSWAVLRLVEEGCVDLDAPAARYLTRWELPQTGFDADAVTVRRLLSHSAGLASAVYSDLPPGAPVPPIEVMLEGNGHPDEAAHLGHPPGSQFVYANPGYAVLELLVEEVTGSPSRPIWTPQS
jgi:D-alanyl-D-alanine carboxypeptidase